MRSGRAPVRTTLVSVAMGLATTGGIVAQEAAVVPYGARNSAAPVELDAFSFLVGKWKGIAKVRLENGDYREDEVVWIGRYVLDGMAIADEGYFVAPGGALTLGGYTLRFFDPRSRSWTVDFVNVANSFVRRQVNPRSGSVQLDGTSVVVSARDDTAIIREYYQLPSKDRFIYRAELSRDGGKSWDTGSFEMTLARVE